MLIRIINSVWERFTTNFRVSDGLKYALVLPFLLAAAPSAFAFSVPEFTRSGGSTTISWSCSTTYCLLQQYVSGSWATQTGSSDSQHAVTVTLPDGTHSFRIQRCTVTGYQYGSSTSCTNDATKKATVKPVPAVPGSLNLPTQSGTGSFTFGWGAVADSTRYRWLERSNGGTWSLYSTTGTGIPKSVLSGIYEFSVQACNEVGCSPHSPSKTVYVSIAPGMPSFTSVPTSPTDGSYSLAWNYVGGTTKYELQLLLNTSGTWSTIYSGPSTSKTESGMGAGSHKYQVRACRTVGTYTNCSSWNMSSAVPVAAPTDVPALTLATSSNTGNYPVSWGSTSNTTSYELQQKIGTGSFITVQNTSSLSKPYAGQDNNSYSYQVRACNAIGCAAFSPIKKIDVAIAPGVPASITVPSGPTDGKHTVSWGLSSGSVTKYDLDRRLGAGSWANAYDGTLRSKTEPGLSAGSWTYRVRACKTVGSYTNCSAFKTSTAVPVGAPTAVPTITLAASSDTGNYPISWTSAGNTTRYELEEQIGAGSWVPQSLSTPLSVLKDYSGKTNNSYSYRVRACNAIGCAAFSPVRTIDVAIAPGVPASITVPGGHTDGNFTVSWGLASGSVTKYDLDRRLGTGSWVNAYDGALRSKPETGLNAGSWTYRVRACKTVGSYTKCSAFRTSTAVPVAPPTTVPTLTLDATSGTGNYSVSWTSSGNSTRYTLQEQIGSGAWTTVQDNSVLSKDYAGKDSGSYSYKIRACNAVGCTPFSAIKTIDVAIAPGVPSSITVPEVTEGSFVIEWGSATGSVTTYRLERSKNGTTGSSKYAQLSRSFTEPGLDVGYYVYRVQACRTTGSFENCSGWRTSNEVRVIEIPIMPLMGFTAEAESGGIALDWSSVASEIVGEFSYYKLQYRIDDGAWIEPHLYKGSATSYYFYNPSTPESEHKFSLEACISVETSGEPFVRCSSRNQEPPPVAKPSSAPVWAVGLASESTDGAYELRWSQVSYAAWYRLQQLNGSGAWTTISDTSGQTYQFAAKPSGSYSYRLQACNGLGCSTAISEIFAVDVARQPDVPGWLTAVTLSDGNHTLSWSDVVNDITHYVLRVSSDNGSNWIQFNTGNARSKSFSSLGLGEYLYQVMAVNTVGNAANDSGWSLSYVINVAAPTVPENISVVNHYDNNYMVTWGGVANTNEYQVQEQVGSGIWSTLPATVSTTSYSFTDKAQNHYSYRVKACNAKGCSTESAAASVQVQIAPDAPASLTATAKPATGKTALSWAAASGAPDNYQVQQGNGGSWSNSQIYDGTSGEWPGAVDTAGDYSYRVRACRTMGSHTECSGWQSSNSVSYAVPDAPVLTAPLSSDNGEYTVFWQVSDIASYYVLQESPGGTNQWTTIEPGANPGTVTLREKTSGSYDYHLQACNSVGCGSHSGIATTHVVLAPGRPASLEVPGKSYGDAIITWAEGTGDLAFYKLQRLSAGNETGVYEGANRNYTDNIDANGTYTYRVQACNRVGSYTNCSAWRTSLNDLTVTAQDAGGAIERPPVFSGDPLATVADPVNDFMSESAYLGVLKGASTVSADGAFNYSIPIDVPPGTNGLQPNLSLAYSSSRRNGLVGWGWSLRGLSSISRCKASTVRDGYTSGVKSGDDFKYCLDGERLVETAAGHYRTEQDRYLRIQQHGSSWTLYDRDGTEQRYGYTDNAREVDGSGIVYTWHLDRRQDIFGNAFSVIYDKSTEIVVGSHTAREHRPSLVSYTSGTAIHSVKFEYLTRADIIANYVGGALRRENKRLAKVVVESSGNTVWSYNLEYQQNDQSYHGKVYSDPSNISRLAKVQKCFKNDTTMCQEALQFDWSEYNKELLTYRATDSDAAARIKALTDATPDGEKLRLFLDIDQNGELDAYYAPDDTHAVDRYKLDGANWVRGTYVPGASYFSMDVNGDGYEDVVKVNSVTSGLQVFPNIAVSSMDGVSREISSTPAPQYSVGQEHLSVEAKRRFTYLWDFNTSDVTTLKQYFGYSVKLVDVNGDGLLDLVRYPPECEVAMRLCNWVDPSNYHDGYSRDGFDEMPRDISVLFNTPSGWRKQSGVIAFNTWYTGLTNYKQEGTLQFSDINADGLPDIISTIYMPGAVEPDIYYLLHNGELAPGQGRFVESTAFAEDRMKGIPGDFNGDGHIDFAYLPMQSTYENADPVAENITVYMGTGNNILAGQRALSDAGFLPFCGNGRLAGMICIRSVVDFNGDGMDDIVEQGYCAGSACEDMPDEDTYVAQVYLSKGGNASGGVSFAMPVIYKNKGIIEQQLGAGVPRNSLLTNKKNPYFFDYNNNGFVEDDARLSHGLKPHRIEKVITKEQKTEVAYQTFGATDSQLEAGATGSEIESEGTSSFVVQNKNSPKKFGVRRLQTTNGTGGMNTAEYSYSGAKTHTAGYGSLGFARVEKLETAAGDSHSLKTVSHYHQVVDQVAGYKLSGKLKRRQVLLTDNSGSDLQTLSDARYRWKVRLYNDDIDTGYSSPHYFPYVYETSEQSWDLDGTAIAASRTQNHSVTTHSCSVISTSTLDTILTASTGGANDNDYHADGVLLYSETASCDTSGSDAAVVIRATENSNITMEGDSSGLVGKRQRHAWAGSSIDSASAGAFSTRATSYTYNDNGSLDSETVQPDAANDEQLKRTTRYTYNTYGSPATITETWTNTPNNGLSFSERVTVINETYDADGTRAVAVTQPLIGTATTAYDAFFGQPVEHTDVNGLTTTTSYDDLGRVENITYADLTTTQVDYRRCSNCFSHSSHAVWYAQTKTTGSAAERTYFDNFDRPVGTRSRGLDGSFVYSTRNYNARGKLVNSTAPFYSWDLQQVTDYDYDPLNRHTATRFPDGSTEIQTYNGLAVTTTNREHQTSVSYKNAAGWVMQSVDNANIPVDFTYSAFGDLKTTKVNNDTDTEISINYDAFGRKRSLQDPDVGIINYTYNPLGLIASETDAKGQVTRYTYDKLGRQRTRTDNATGTPRIHTWTYDTRANGKGQLASVSGYNTDGTAYLENYTYTAFSLPATITAQFDNKHYSVTQHYDDYNRPLGTTYPYGYQVAQVYNVSGHLAQVVNTADNQPLWIANEADARGNIRQFTLGDGTTTTRHYDPVAGVIESIRAERGGAVLQDHHYQFDRIGNLTERRDQLYNVTQSFCYDDLNRLTAARFNGCSDADNDYTYDALGNIRSKLYVGNYAYDQVNAGPHAVTAANGLSYEYDLNGNLTTARNGDSQIVRQVDYSPFNKPTRITNNAHWTEVTYGPNKARIKRQDSTGRTTHYFGKLFEETTHGANTERVHYIGDFAIFVEKLGLDQDSYHQFLHRDHIGSIVAKTTDKDTAADWLAYEPWGNQLHVAWDSGFLLGQEPDISTARGFTDHEHLDPVGLIHMNGRVYDPELGRFLSPDPFIQAPYHTQSYNRYSYVFNNPLSFVDPTGYTCGDPGPVAEGGITYPCNDFEWYDAGPGTWVHDYYQMQEQMNQQRDQQRQYRSWGTGITGTANVLPAVSDACNGDFGCMNEVAKDSAIVGGLITGGAIFGLEGVLACIANPLCRITVGAAGAAGFGDPDVEDALSLGLGGKLKLANEASPLNGTIYTDKVKRQMQGVDLDHNFPSLVDTQADAATVRKITGGDGIERTKVELPGSINGKDGSFSWIIEPDQTINHRLFERLRE